MRRSETGHTTVDLLTVDLAVQCCFLLVKEKSLSSKSLDHELESPQIIN